MVFAYGAKKGGAREIFPIGSAAHCQVRMSSSTFSPAGIPLTNSAGTYDCSIDTSQTREIIQQPQWDKASEELDLDLFRSTRSILERHGRLDEDRTCHLTYIGPSSALGATRVAQYRHVCGIVLSLPAYVRLFLSGAKLHFSFTGQLTTEDQESSPASRPSRPASRPFSWPSRPLLCLHP